MSIREELSVEEIHDEEAILLRPNYRRIEYPVDWIPFPVKVGDVLECVVYECSADRISRIDFTGFAG